MNRLLLIVILLFTACNNGTEKDEEGWVSLSRGVAIDTVVNGHYIKLEEINPQQKVDENGEQQCSRYATFSTNNDTAIWYGYELKAILSNLLNKNDKYVFLGPDSRNRNFTLTISSFKTINEYEVLQVLLNHFKLHIDSVKETTQGLLLTSYKPELLKNELPAPNESSVLQLTNSGIKLKNGAVKSLAFFLDEHSKKSIKADPTIAHKIIDHLEMKIGNVEIMNKELHESGLKLEPVQMDIVKYYINTKG